MNREDNLKPFEPGQSGNPNGRPLGAKNRSTIARKVLEMTALYKDEALKKLQEQYPGITKDTTVEEMMTIVMANKAISDGDHNAYKALQDSAYGAPKQDIEANVHQTIVPILSNDPLSHVDNDHSVTQNIIT